MSILRGVNIPPALVGFARGLVETAVLAALGAAALYVTDSEFGSEMWAVLLVWVIRTVEGVADQIDPAR